MPDALSIFCQARRHLTCLGDARSDAGRTSHVLCTCECHLGHRHSLGHSSFDCDVCLGNLEILW